ncbi:MAG: RpiB/LacA/LacB family sugar-phosphate isomerase [Candidatus Omnitrophota bacterium]
MAKKIVIGADHGGFRLKESLKKILQGAGYIVEDVGTWSDEPADYPRFGFDAAKKVSEGKAARGIVICKSGIGMSIIANKLPGVRAGLCHTKEDAVSSRRHNDANILVLAATKLTPGKAGGIAKAWLEERSLKGRHSRRVRQIKEMEKKLFRKTGKRG